MANYYSLGQKQHTDAKILKIGHRLDMSVCEQSFSIKRHYNNILEQKIKNIWHSFFLSFKERCNFNLTIGSDFTVFSY